MTRRSGQFSVNCTPDLFLKGLTEAGEAILASFRIFFSHSFLPFYTSDESTTDNLTSAVPH